ncbi:hypothetical protein, partial [Trichlorobacter lovleyi]|uniref:hypothetical protein n=1 Tax=Trichlorobacter lovleyi TaxID=313985 RepID=UPI0024806ED1
LGKQDEPPSLHRYLYAYSNPTVYVDLEGYASIKANLNGMATLAANLFGDLILRNNESVPRLVNGKLISERKSYEVNFEGADPRKWIKTRTAEYDALAAYNKQLSDRGAIAKGALDYHTLGLSGIVTGNFDAVKGVGRSLSSLKRSFDSSLSEVEQNAASFEAGHEFLSSAVVLGTLYRAKPSVVRTVESKVGAAQAAAIEMEAVGGSWTKKQSGVQTSFIKTESASSSSNIDFYVGPTGPESTLPSKGYRYMRYLNDDGSVNKYALQTLKTKQAPGSYFGFDSFKTGKAARNAFQIKGPEFGESWSDARLKGEFNTLQLYNNGVPNVQVPLVRGGKGPELEPFTVSYPEYGNGNIRQLITDQKIFFNKVKILPE